jgi:hypothetical protein
VFEAAANGRHLLQLEEPSVSIDDQTTSDQLSTTSEALTTFVSQPSQVSEPVITTQSTNLPPATTVPPATSPPNPNAPQTTRAYLNGGFDASEMVMWGTAGVSVRNVGGEQTLSFSFTGPFTAFHYDPFVAEPHWDSDNIYGNGNLGLRVGVLSMLVLSLAFSLLL